MSELSATLHGRAIEQYPSNSQGRCDSGSNLRLQSAGCRQHLDKRQSPFESKARIEKSRTTPAATKATCGLGSERVQPNSNRKQLMSEED